jgi:hypothetical protein
MLANERKFAQKMMSGGLSKDKPKFVPKYKQATLEKDLQKRVDAWLK